MTSVLWDMGGTLFDTYPSINEAFFDLLSSHGYEITLSAIASLTRVSRGHAIRTLSERSGVPEIDFESAYETVKEAWKQSPPPLMDGVEEILELVTSTSGLNLVVTHRDRTSAEQLLRSSGLIVDDLISTSDGYPRKPDPTMMIAIMSRNNVSPEDCVAIGDRPIDIESARAAGVTPVLLHTDAVNVDTPGAHHIVSIRSLTTLIR